MPVTPCPARWLGSLPFGVLRLGFCFGGFARNDPVDAIALELLGFESETEFLSHDTREEATHRVLLPAVAFVIAAIVAPLAGSARNHGCLLGFERGVAARAVVA